MDFLATIGKLFADAAPWIAAGTGLLSTISNFQGAGAIEEQGRINREMYEAEAAATWRAYEDRASIMAHEQRLFYATQRTAYAKSGVEIQGSPMEMLNDIIYRQGQDRRALYTTAVAERKKLLTQANLDEWQGYQQGSAIRTQALSNFGSTLLSANLNYPTGWGYNTRHVATVGKVE